MAAPTAPAYAEEQGFFERLFAPRSVEASSPREAVAAPQRSTRRSRHGYGYDYGWGYHWDDRGPWRGRRYGRRSPSRYVSLPKADPVMIRPAGVPEVAKPILACRLPAPDPVLAVLRDKTLRKGDIVMLRDGPRVFTGRSDKAHTAGDFEPVGRSRRGDLSASELIAARTAPIATGSFEEMQGYLAAHRQLARTGTLMARVRVSLPVAVRTVSP